MAESAIFAKEILVCESAGIDRDAEFVSFAVPCCRGEFAPAPLRLAAPGGASFPCQSRVLKSWPDGSVKWLLVDARLSVPAGARLSLQLVRAEQEPELPQQLNLIRSGSGWQVDTGVGSFFLDGAKLSLLRELSCAGQSLVAPGGVGWTLTTADGTPLEPVLGSLEVEHWGPLRGTLRLEGHFSGAGQRLPLSCRLHFHAGTLLVQADITLGNARAAQHPGGLWDLGDPGSCFIREFSLELALTGDPKDQAGCLPEPGARPVLTAAPEGITLFQESSGGERWQHPTHRTASGQVSLRQPGYLLEHDGQASSGRRAAPVAWCGTPGRAAVAALPRFWQEFPKLIACRPGALTVSFFPARSAEPHELQGGEQKTHTLYLAFDADPARFAWATAPLQPVAAPEVYRASGIFGDLPAPAGDLVDQFVSGLQLLERREPADEFGWRNFGDLHADHESVGSGNDRFVSHYNNQYDGCAGAYRKYFATGDPAWGALAADLARHVLDIDLYHTAEDREEYNGGLFWHTDHYIDAGLSTHRSVSREHLAVKDPRFCGGGPGAEHCYSTGLLWHYYQTGNSDYRSAVLQLAKWCQLSLRGPQTVLAALLRALRQLRRVRQRDAAASVFPRFPLTRGTGNAITACLDAFEASGERSYLAGAEELIRGALHPDDDVAARQLHQVETAWSYTVLLGAVAKYLDRKRGLGELDAPFWYARGALLRYADWMAEHEYPYLQRPEILEYPNETWAAQELRKAVVLRQAACYASGEARGRYWDRARSLALQARQDLVERPTSSLVRPVILMLQNGWVLASLEGEVPAYKLPPEPARSATGRGTPRLGLGVLAWRTLGELAAAARVTSPTRELRWLRSRLGRPS